MTSNTTPHIDTAVLDRAVRIALSQRANHLEIALPNLFNRIRHNIQSSRLTNLPPHFIDRVRDLYQHELAAQQ